MSESHVLTQIENALRPLMIPDDQIDDIIAYIKKTSASEQTNQRELKHRYRKEIADIETKIDRLTDLLVNNHITEDAHQRKISQL